MERFQEFVSIAPWTMIFTWVNLIILVFVMKKLLFKPVLKIIEQRENEVSSMYEKAEVAKKNAEDMESDYTKKLSSAKEEALRIVKDASREATLKGEQIISEAQQKASAAIKKAENEIEREKKAAVNEIKNDIASIAVDVAQKVIEKEINESDYERLIEEFIENSGESK